MYVGTLKLGTCSFSLTIAAQSSKKINELPFCIFERERNKLYVILNANINHQT